MTNVQSTGESGVCYIDRVNEGDPTPALDLIDATNPCGDQPPTQYAKQVISVSHTFTGIVHGLFVCSVFEYPVYSWTRT